MEFDFSVTGAAQQRLLEIAGQILPRLFEALVEVLCRRAEHRFVVNDHPLAAAPPRQDGALFERLFMVGDD